MAGGLREKHEPFRPVAAQVEEVLEIQEAGALEIGNQSLKSGVVEDRSDDEQVTFNTELLVSEAESFIDGRTSDSGSFKRTAPYEKTRVVR